MFEINVGSSLLDYYASVSVVCYFYCELNLLTLSLFYFGIMTVTIPGMFCFPRKLPYYKSCVLFTGIVLDKLVSIVIKLSFFLFNPLSVAPGRPTPGVWLIFLCSYHIIVTIALKNFISVRFGQTYRDTSKRI